MTLSQNAKERRISEILLIVNGMTSNEVNEVFEEIKRSIASSVPLDTLAEAKTYQARADSTTEKSKNVKYVIDL